MFVDASAIVAILTRESDADDLADLLGAAARQPITSAIAIFEAVAGLCRKKHVSVEEASEEIRTFLETANVHVVGITNREADAALKAFDRYGKGRGHPAQLNMGDCFAYACAKTYRASLLFKGEDFVHTDIGIA